MKAAAKRRQQIDKRWATYASITMHMSFRIHEYFYYYAKIIISVRMQKKKKFVVSFIVQQTR